MWTYLLNADGGYTHCISTTCNTGFAVAAAHLEPTPHAVNLQSASVVEGGGAGSSVRWGQVEGLGEGLRVGLEHAGRLHTVQHHREVFLLHVSQRQQWLKQSPDLALWRRDGGAC